MANEGLLDSALEAPFMTFGGKDLHSDELEKIVRFGYGLISNHPFHDGNKRIGALVLLTLLELNGYTILIILFVLADNFECTLSTRSYSILLTQAAIR